MAEYIEYDPTAQDEESPAAGYVPYDPDAAAKQAAIPTARDEAVRKLTGPRLAARRAGLLLRIPAEVATGTLGALGDASAGIMGLATGKYTPSPIGSESIRKQLNRFVPEPETFEEKAVDVVGQIGAGRLDRAGMAIARGLGGAAPNAPAAFKPARDQIRSLSQELHQEGVKLLPGEGKGGITGRFLAGIGDESRIAQKLQIDNQEQANTLARKAAGLNPQLELTHENLIKQAQTIADIGYRPVREAGAIGVGQRFRFEMRKIESDLASNRSFPAADKDEIFKVINKHLYDEVGSDGNPVKGARLIQKWTGDDAVKRIQALREEAASRFREPGGDKDVPRALNRIANAIEDQVDFYLTRTNRPQLVKQFRETRKQLAKNFAVRKMLSDQHTGTVDPVKAKRLQDGGEKLTGELETLAKMGSFPKSTRAPTGEPSLYSPWEQSVIAGGVATGTFPGAGIFGPAVAASVAGRPLVRKAVESGPMQSFMFGQQPQAVTPETRRLMQLQAARLGAPYMSIFNPYEQEPQ